MTDKYQNFIAGAWKDAKSGETFENKNPANADEFVGVFPSSGPEDVEEAVAAARSAFDAWRKTPAPRRGEIISKAEKLLKDRKEEIARLATREMGKILTETLGDVQEGIDTAFYMASEGRRLFGQTSPSELGNKFCMSVRMPMGVAGLITPWNFPMAIPTWKMFPALICGDTVVLKPASDAPATATKLVEIMSDAGVPEGVVNIVHGSGTDVGMPMVNHPEVDVIAFTGSADTGRVISVAAGRHLKRLSLEMGGKNAQIVMDDADLELAVEGATWGSFGTTGQRCTATSRLIVHRDVLDQFTQMLLAKAKAIRIGDGLKPDTDMGPLINAAALEKVERYVEIGKKEDGAELICGGSRYTDGDCAKGFFFEPTVFAGGDRNMRIAREEIFGPVVLILPVGGFEEAVDVLNATNYGLSSSIYTQDVNRAFAAIRDIECGITYINGPTIGAETHLPFGGFKNTGNGHRESGTEVLNSYSEWKSVYIDYSGKLQKAQIDTFEQ